MKFKLKKIKRNKRFLLPIIALILLGIAVLFIDGPKRETKILFVGDMMFDRTIRSRIDEKGFDYIFSCVKSTLNKYDLVVGNLEGPITSNQSLSLNTVPGDLNNTTFTFPVETSKALAKNNIKAVSLANNHILNFGYSGLGETRESLQKNGVEWFGDPGDLSKKSLVKDDVVIIGFNQFLGVDSVENTVKEIKNKKSEKNTVIVFAHWGLEYLPTTNYQKLWAHTFVDAGADLVLGAHPHIIQESENYKGKMIYYSLGNFIFDQWWDESVSKGMGIELTLRDDSLQTHPILFSSSRTGQTCTKN